MTFALFARSKQSTDTPAPRKQTGSVIFANLDKLENLPHLSDTTVRAMALANDPEPPWPTWPPSSAATGCWPPAC